MPPTLDSGVATSHADSETEAYRRKVWGISNGMTHQQSVVIVNLAEYPWAAIHKAAHALSNLVQAKWTSLDDGRVEVRLTPANPSVEILDIESTFLTKLMDTAIQERINSETRLIREALVLSALRGSAAASES